MKHEITLTRALPGSGSGVNFTGNWVNELNSIAHLTQSGDRLSGTYVSKVSGSGGSTTGDLCGYVDGDLISFVVHWRDFQAITSWVGQLRSGTTPQTLDTLWQMTTQVAPGEEWASINAGADTFTRVT